MGGGGEVGRGQVEQDMESAIPQPALDTRLRPQERGRQTDKVRAVAAADGLPAAPSKRGEGWCWWSTLLPSLPCKGGKTGNRGKDKTGSCRRSCYHKCWQRTEVHYKVNEHVYVYGHLHAHENGHEHEHLHVHLQLQYIFIYIYL